MVRHGTQRKRRAGRKVTRKAQHSWARKQQNAVKDETMRGKWDVKASIDENYQKAGLTAKVNKNSDVRSLNSKEAAFEGYTEVGEVLNKRSAFFRDKMGRLDQEMAVSLIDKHGDNYLAMQRDIKTNVQQLSENQAKKICEKYLNLLPENRVAELKKKRA